MQVYLDDDTVEFLQDYIDNMWSKEPDHNAEENYQIGKHYTSSCQQENLLELVYRILIQNRGKFVIGGGE